jgi:hypothetical protein
MNDSDVIVLSFFDNIPLINFGKSKKYIHVVCLILQFETFRHHDEVSVR